MRLFLFYSVITVVLVFAVTQFVLPVINSLQHVAALIR